MHMKNIKEIKNEARKKYRSIREKMVPEKKKIMDDEILRKLILLGKYQKSKTVLIYVSKKIEVSTYEIMRDAWNRRKRVAVPKCNTQNKSMDFYYINSMNDLEEGTFGVYEPIGIKCDIVKNLSEGICIVPGFSFDTSGYRLGYGQGYYDRFLARFKGFTVGICYSNCINFRLPRGKFDKPIDILVTDKYIKKIYKPRRQTYEMRGKFSGSKLY